MTVRHRRRPMLFHLALAVGLGVAAGPRVAWAAGTAPGLMPPAHAGMMSPAHAVSTPAGTVTELTLANGLKVLLVENHAAPVVTWVVSYKVGSRNEGPGITGAAHLLEHMMFKGTRTLGKGQVAQVLGRNGASSNATTSLDQTKYYETYGSDRLELGLMVEAARMRGALVRDDERQSEMTVVRNEMERGESNPSRVLSQALASAAFLAHPYHHPTIGWRSDVEHVPTAALKRFYDAYYQPNNAVAVLVGDFKTPEATALIRRYFDPIPMGPPAPPMYTREEAQTGERRVSLHRRGATNLVRIGYHIPDVRSPDLAPLLVLDQVLSSGINGRLYQRLVETQLATSAFANASVRRDPALFELGATLKPGTSHQAAEQALEAIVTQLQTQPVTARELQKAKNQVEAQRQYQSAGTAGLAFDLAFYETIDHWQRTFTLDRDIQAVAARDILRVAKTYLQPDNRTVAYYVATPDGPLPPAPHNAGGGTAKGAGTRGKPLAAFAFERHPKPASRLTKPTRRVLSNGMTLLVLENDAAPTVAVDGYVCAGDLLDPPGKDGLALAVAAMLHNGTRRHDKLALADALEFVDASVSFSGGLVLTSVGARSLAKDLDLALATFAEELQMPAFPAGELAKLKSRWIAGMRRAEDSPGTRANRLFSQAIFPKGHPYYEDDLADQVKAIESLTVADLQAFHRRYYGPNTTTLAVVGRVKADAVAAKLERLFATWPAATRTAGAIPDVPLGAAKRLIAAMPDKTNVQLVFGHAGAVKRLDPDFYAAQLANAVLGGDTLTSRLGRRLRDELGLTYGVTSGFSAGVGAGPWRASITTNPANVKRAKAELSRVIAGYLREGITPGELAGAKSAFIGRQAVGLASNSGMAASLTVIEYYGLGLDFWARYPDLIQRVTREQVNAAARRLIHPDALTTVEAGPVK